MRRECGRLVRSEAVVNKLPFWLPPLRIVVVSNLMLCTSDPNEAKQANRPGKTFERVHGGNNPEGACLPSPTSRILSPVFPVGEEEITLPRDAAFTQP